MKRSFLYSSILLFSLAGISASASAQSESEIRVSPCSIQSIQDKADSLKHLLSKGGYSVLREASISMESAYDIPIIVPMDEGAKYQFVFIGDEHSATYEVRMYDYHENQVVYKKNESGKKNTNIIRYAYTPKGSEYHMIKPLQINNERKSDLCGYVMLFKETKAKAKKGK